MLEKDTVQKVEQRNESNGSTKSLDLTLELLYEISELNEFLTKDEVMNALRNGDRVYTVTHSYRLIKDKE